MKNPKPIIRLNEFSESGFLFLVRGFISSAYTLDQWDIASEVRFIVIKELRKAGIEIAVPVRRIIDIHMNKVQDSHTKQEKK